MYTLAAQAGGANWALLIVVYVLIFGGFWFIFIRPQKKEQKRVQAMIASMEVGDSVLTTSGFYGVVIDINDSDVDGMHFMQTKKRIQIEGFSF